LSFSAIFGSSSQNSLTNDPPTLTQTANRSVLRSICA